MYPTSGRTRPDRTGRGRGRARGAGVGLAAALGLATLAVPGTAAAASRSIDHATFEWGVNAVWQGAAANGSCNQFVAGIGDGTESTYKTVDGNLHLIKRGLDGSAVTVTADDRCAEMAPGDAAQRGLWVDGTGTTDPDTGATTVQWTGALTVNSYGGAVPWYVKDPKLVTDGDGTGAIYATVGGYTSSLADPTTKTPLPPQIGVRVLDLKDVSISGDDIAATPVYEGVDYYPLNKPDDPDSGRRATSVITDEVKQANPHWGSWPTPFVDFQYRTGLSSYWHSSGLSADPKKPPLPIELGLAGALPATQPLADAPKITAQPVGVAAVTGEDATFSVTATGDDLRYSWQRSPAAAPDWKTVAGAHSSTLTVPTVTAADSDTSYRAVVTNGQRGTYSTGAGLTVGDAKPLAVASGTSATTVFAGNDVTFEAYFTGYPTPKYKPQLSTDEGKTWTDLAGFGDESYHTILGVTEKQNDALLRILADNGRERLAGTPGVLHVLPKPTTPTLVRRPNDQDALPVLDAAKGFSVLALAGGYPAPTPAHYDAVVPAAVWSARGSSYDGTGAVAATEVDGSGFDAGYGYAYVDVAAGALDPSVRYVLATYSTDPADRSLDAAVPLVLSGQEVVASTARVTLSRSSAAFGTALKATVAVTRAGKAAAGKVTVGIGSRRYAATLDKAGRASVALPRTLGVGTYRVSAAYAGNGTTKASSAATTLRIVKATAKARLAITKKPTSHKTGRAAVRVVRTASGPVAPTGTVRVYFVRGGKTASVAVSVRKAALQALTVPKLAKGTWRLYVRYSGSAQYRAIGKTAAGRLTVTR
ncbi:Ig-like domain (group 3) [Jatrophihabitans endophyticus]|uniref:Ig-like domain (Group 3) n=1 Tax=Jatrophihabitans endophyticus TaxID=1206085 RepID=A0A1M5Q505_9ACTN|nr:Ig-like domain repeat protein [Jatrophihabitans endophyticus]SHH08881.1 Ig-like domain (group 3) [Jatrophihabitans endophyticus]